MATIASSLLKPQSSLDYLNQSPMPSGKASVMPETEPVLLKPTFSPNTQSGGGSWTSPQIAQATPAPTRVAQAPAPTIAQVYNAPQPMATATPAPAPQPAYDFSQDALTPQANVSGSVDAMLRQVQPAQKPFVNTYWDPGLGRYVEGNMETDRPWEKYGLGSANALYNTDPNTLRALQQRNTIGGQYGEYLQSQIKPLDEEAIRRQTIDRFQAEIDAMNRYYAEKTAGELAREREAGRARVGTRTAISARRGMLGGDFGDAARETVVRYNQDVENRIVNLNEKERIFQELQMRGEATKAAEEAIDKAKAELERAYEKSQKWQEKIKGEIQERVTNRLAALALDGTEMTDDDYQKIARELGIDVDTVKATALAMRPEPAKQTGDAAEFAYFNSLTPEQQTAYLKFKQETAAPTSLGATVNEYEYYKRQEEAAGRTPVSFNEYQTLDANRKARAAAITAGGLNSAQQSAAFKLADDYEKASGTLPKVISNYNSVSAAANDPSPAGDISLIFAYMKMLDPTSVVREGEFATAQNAGSIPTSIQNIWNKAVQGTRLTPEQRTDFINQANKLYQSALQQQRQVDQTFEERSRQFGVPSSLVVRGQSSYLDTSTQPTPSVLPPEKQRDFDELKELTPDLSDEEIMGILGFSSVGSDTKPATGGNTPYLKTLGAITGIDGSPLWKHGLDIDLKIGDPVKSPVSGTVIATRTSPKGFGKQVRVKGDDGNEYWFSHLDGFDVVAGAKIRAGQVVGRGGNTGSVIPMGGGDGSHLDLTVKDKNGNYIPPRKIKKMLDKVMV